MCRGVGFILDWDVAVPWGVAAAEVDRRVVSSVGRKGRGTFSTLCSYCCDCLYTCTAACMFSPSRTGRVIGSIFVGV